MSLTPKLKARVAFSLPRPTFVAKKKVGVKHTKQLFAAGHAVYHHSRGEGMMTQRVALLTPCRRSDSRCRSLVLALTLMLLLSSSTAGAQQLRAKSLFYGTPAGNANPYGPVGFQYWFEDATTPLRWNEVGARIVSPGTLAAGTALRLHIVLNTPAYLGIWLAKGSGDARGVELTPSEGRYSSFFFQANREYIMGGEILIPPAGADASVIILMSRAQSENAGSARSAREKIRVVSARPTPDGGPAIVQETDTTTPSESGVYVVHRRGLQPGIEIPLGAATRN